MTTWANWTLPRWTLWPQGDAGPERTAWPGWLPSLRSTRAPVPGIDLGNGRVLGAEDVLEGHYRRMAGQIQPQTPVRPRQVLPMLSPQRTRRAAVQVGRNLVVPITVLAPELAPLTELAEEVAGVVPPVLPEPQFREHLHQALERTHRQYAAQRALGTRSAPPPPQPVWKLGTPALVLIALLVLLVAWRSWGRSPREAGAAT